MKNIIVACLLGLLVSSAFADVYMHNPRGNNDRCDEQSNDRQNNRRLFDSQNNEAGGYCINTEPMYFYMGSQLSIEWTSQHSCGNDGKVNCNYVLQYACEDTLTTSANDGPVKDGTPAANPENGNQNQCTGTVTNTNPSNPVTGLNEASDYFNNCNVRQRNGGLLTLDQNLNGNTAQFTRQNPGGTTYGFECQEERDYYPYWGPTPWKDIAILTSRPNLCQDIYQSQSQNVAPRYFCSNPIYNNMAACTGAGGTWNTAPAFGIPAPDCIQAPWGRDNHLGSTNDGFMARYNWSLPYGNNPNNPTGAYNTCILRLRYNISTGDYNDFLSFKADNTKLINQGITTDPPVTIGSVSLSGSKPFEVQLAIDTTQFGRTFQDRSYHWSLVPRPSGIDKKDTLWNVNVRGKRGNIAQVRNCMEYDFTPNILQINSGDIVHFQWTGCDRNDPNNDGEGTDRTDRTNVAQMSDWTSSFPIPLESQNMFDSYSTALNAALLGQTNCVPVKNLNGDEQTRQNCGKLNGVKKPIYTTPSGAYPNNGDQSNTGAGISYTAYFDLGAIRWNNTGTYQYMGTRNNNFSNRGQKAVLIVGTQLSAAAIAGIVVGSAAAVALIAVGGLFIAGRMMPDSWAASVLARFGML